MTPEEIKAQEENKRQREYTRSVFWIALKVYQARAVFGAKSIPLGMTGAGGRSDPAWEKWSQWRADFEVCVRHVLRDEFLFIYEHYTCYPDGHPEKLSIRETVVKLHEIFGSGTISMKLFYSTNSLIAEKVGGELLRRGVWPTDEYMRKTGAAA